VTSPPTPRKILIADDNRDGADTLAIMLDFLGFQTAVAYNGEEAVEAAQNFKPDVIVLDINMPVMNGYEAAKTIRRTLGHERAVLVALTAYDSPEAVQQAREAGFDLHLRKPMEGAQLSEVIRRICVKT